MCILAWLSYVSSAMSFAGCHLGRDSVAAMRKEAGDGIVLVTYKGSLADTS